MTEAPRPPGEPEPDPTAPPPYPAPDPPGYAPPSGYAPPPPGYGPSAPPPGFPTADDKTWALIAHFGGAAGMFIGGGILGWVAPLIALVAKGNLSPKVREHAVAALNFQLLWSVVGMIGWITVCMVVGFFGIGAAYLMGIIFGIIAGVRANEGQPYTYPATITIVK
ncbi:MAG TPA: DUF4870 domain-containing protein [Micromonosporaceae bacterium]|nr:DUF4870 domain-containing protein [Micromonosporaceae bacterium]